MKDDKTTRNDYHLNLLTDCLIIYLWLLKSLKKKTIWNTRFQITNTLQKLRKIEKS